MNLLRISLTYFPIFLLIFDFVNIMPSQGSKSLLAPSSNPHTILRKSTGESPLIKTTRASLSVEMRTYQFTNSLSPRSNESIKLPGEDSRELVSHPKDEDVELSTHHNKKVTIKVTSFWYGAWTIAGRHFR